MEKCIKKYGKENVAQIITFGTMKAKSSLRDVGRVLGLPYGEVDRIAKMVPDEIGISLKQAEKKNPELAKISEIDDIHKELIGGAQMGRQIIIRFTSSF